MIIGLDFSFGFSAAIKRLPVLFCNNAVNRAIGFANAAVDALFRIDHVDVTGGDAVNRAVFFAGAAGDTCVQDSSWHVLTSLEL